MADCLMAGGIWAQLQHISQSPLQQPVALWLISLQWTLTDMACLCHTTSHTCSSMFLPCLRENGRDKDQSNVGKTHVEDKKMTSS